MSDMFLVFPCFFWWLLSFGSHLVLLRESVGETVKVALNSQRFTVNNALCNCRHFGEGILRGSSSALPFSPIQKAVLVEVR